MHNKQIVRQISAPVPRLVAIRAPRLTRTNGLKFQTQAAPSRHPERRLHQMSGERIDAFRRSRHRSCVDALPSPYRGVSRGDPAASPEAEGRPATVIGGPFPIHRDSGADRGIATAAGYVDSVKALHCDANKRNPRERCISMTPRATFCVSHNLPDISVEVHRTRSLRREALVRVCRRMRIAVASPAIRNGHSPSLMRRKACDERRWPKVHGGIKVLCFNLDKAASTRRSACFEVKRRDEQGRKHGRCSGACSFN